MALDWRKARPRKPTEAAIGQGFVRKDGRVTPVLPKDSLAKRAEAAERAWIARGRRPARSFSRQKPNYPQAE